MLQAMNTGHDGSLSTVHANSPARRDRPPGDPGADGRHGPAAARHPRADRLRGRRHRPAHPAARRHPPGHPRHRGAGHGGGDRHPAGRLPLRLRRRRRRRRHVPRQADPDRRPAAVHRPVRRARHHALAARLRRRRAGRRGPGERRPALLVDRSGRGRRPRCWCSPSSSCPAGRVAGAADAGSTRRPRPPASALAGAGAAAGAAVEKALARRGRLGRRRRRAGAGRDVDARCRTSCCVVGLRDRRRRRPSALVLGGPLLGLLAAGGRAARRQARCVGVQGRPAAARVRRPARRLAAAAWPAACAPGTACCGRVDVGRPRGREPDRRRSSPGSSTRPGSAGTSATRWTRPRARWPATTSPGSPRPSPSTARSAATSPRCSTRSGTPSGSATRSAARSRRCQREGKLSAIVLMALPFGITGFISLTNPGYLAEVHRRA